MKISIWNQTSWNLLFHFLFLFNAPKFVTSDVLKWIQILALFIFLLWFVSYCCLTVNNLSKTIIWIPNSHQVDLTKSNLLKWTTLILKLVCIFWRSQRGKRGFVIHFVGFSFFLMVEHILAVFFVTVAFYLAFTCQRLWNFCDVRSP